MSVEIRFEHDVVLARQRTRQIAETLGFENQDQVRLATAVSELARNAFQYAGGGKVEFSLTKDQIQSLQARVSDKGKGIPNIDSILNGQYVSKTGMGLGILGARRLMDKFELVSTASGTTATISKRLPHGTARVQHEDVGRLVQRIAMQSVQNPFAEIQRQNQDLLATMAELEKRQQELSQLNRELEDTNRGVVALYAELDQRADYLRRVSESKTRFLSNMTHEFRTPLNSILSISRMLADRLDGELTDEQARQVGFIRKAAGDLSNLVNDLLDLAKVEAGKATVRPEPFDLKGVFNSLRGTLRPLLSQHSAVNLVFEEPENMPLFETDESKLAQILRNFISNALKYTERGEVRVLARMDGPAFAVICVADTGIGIDPENHARIFEEFEQVEGSHQLGVKGTGLGLPLSKALAELLGGSVSVESERGVGSTFRVRVPIRFGDTGEEAPAMGARRVLIIDDDDAARYVLRNLLPADRLIFAEADGGKEGLRLACEFKPDLIFLDLHMPDLDGRAVLRELKQNPMTRQVPVIINTSQTLDPMEKEEFALHAADILSKNDPDPRAIRATVNNLLAAVPRE
jgi:signal transduction histidine kinase